MGQADQRTPSAQALIEQVVAAESGARRPAGAATRRLIAGLAIAWSLFQLWIASPLPFWVAQAAPALQRLVMFNDTTARAIHLTFAVLIVFLAYPFSKRSPRDHVPAADWLVALAAAFCTGYIYLFHDQLSTRQGRPTTLDIAVACAGVVLLLEATRRCLGRPMTIMGIVFLAYMFGGQVMPEMIAHKGDLHRGERAVSAGQKIGINRAGGQLLAHQFQVDTGLVQAGKGLG